MTAYSRIKLQKTLLATTLAAAMGVPTVALAETTHPAIAQDAHIEKQIQQTPDVLVPLRTVVEQIGATIQWDNQSRSAVVTFNGTQVALKIGELTATVDGKNTPLNQKTELIGNRTHVSKQFLNEILGIEITGQDAQLKVEQVRLETLAKQFVNRVARGDFERAKQHFNTRLQETVSVKMIEEQWNTFKKNYGGLSKLNAAYAEQNGVHHNIHLLFEGPAPIQITVRFDKEGNIDDFTLLSDVATYPDTYQLPAYAKPETYTEQEVIVGANTEWATPSTLTLPKGEGPFPVAILVQGSGRINRDEELGKLLIFKDLAAGLASNGIATLRYEKRNLEHDQKLRALPYLLKEEAIDDAVTAIDLLNDFPDIDPTKIFIVGHSQGGMLVPYIINADKTNSIAGAISMAGPSRPKEDILFNGTYRFKSGWLPEEMYKAWVADTELISDTTFTLDDPRTSALFEKNFIISLRDMHPAEESKKQTTPLFLMQGGRDYQVPAASLDNWKQVLGDRANVTSRLYPKLGHFMVEGTGQGELSTPMELFMEDHIPNYVLDDMVNWIKSVKKN